DPDLGRFLQADPMLDGTNRYTYCGNNPIIYCDPSGHCSTFPLTGTTGTYTIPCGNPNCTGSGGYDAGAAAAAAADAYTAAYQAALQQQQWNQEFLAQSQAIIDSALSSMYVSPYDSDYWANVIAEQPTYNDLIADFVASSAGGYDASGYVDSVMASATSSGGGASTSNLPPGGTYSNDGNFYNLPRDNFWSPIEPPYILNPESGLWDQPQVKGGTLPLGVGGPTGFGLRNIAFKAGGGGSLQAYSTLTGRFVKLSKFQKSLLRINMTDGGQFSVGFAQGVASSMSGVDAPEAITRSQALGQYTGQIVNNLLPFIFK
ncbi:MAG: hypothetical protein JEY91_13680, partial [Spirochaetaceae bacterium]|nr:hypothetical protein [Spirochaetaceae bacterium]